MPEQDTKKSREEVKLRFLHPPRTGGTSIHKSWKIGPPEYRGHALPADGESFRYGFTRNPWDRVVSLYHILNPREETPFRTWVIEGMRCPAYEGIPIVSPTITWLRGAHFIGRFENRDHDCAYLAQMLGRSFPGEHRNKTDRRQYQIYYDDTTRHIIEVLYHEDIIFFDYKFEEVM